MKFYSGKNVILTGATGGVGSKVAKKLIKAGKNHLKLIQIGARVIMLVQDPSKVEAALNIKDSRIKSGREYVPITLNLSEPY